MLEDAVPRAEVQRTAGTLGDRDERPRTGAGRAHVTLALAPVAPEDAFDAHVWLAKIVVVLPSIPGLGFHPGITFSPKGCTKAS